MISRSSLLRIGFSKEKYSLNESKGWLLDHKFPDAVDAYETKLMYNFVYDGNVWGYNAFCTYNVKKGFIRAVVGYNLKDGHDGSCSMYSKDVEDISKLRLDNIYKK